MKNIKSISLFLISLFLLTSCSADDSNSTPPELNPLEGWQLIKDFSTPAYTAALYSPKKQLQVGSNPVIIQLKSKATAPLSAPEWKTTMHMKSMQHGAPVLPLKPYGQRGDLFEGQLFFQMAGDGSDNYWELEVQFKDQAQTAVLTTPIEVVASKYRRIQSFEGRDKNNYVLALIEPETPKIGINDLSAALFKMESMDRFTLVSEGHIQIDPRMPSMQNHSSPNNLALTSSAADALYRGKLSLTMSGYWKINLQWFDANGNLIKGEAVDDNNNASSLFFELEF
ncbi:hypothetical protein [Flavobacterium sp. JP2137]|uniref:hypothetical protein n=1 Tax=Flavobacterium sp. JP2137 TaxID=3414510 RepID=UPI003D2FB311